VKPISLCELSRVQVPVVMLAGSAMVLLLVICGGSSLAEGHLIASQNFFA
jgi:hypothetical protein